jgi:hypothetical protein
MKKSVKAANLLGLELHALCKVIRESEDHFFKSGTHCYFNGTVVLDPVNTSSSLYGMVGKIDGYLLVQWLEVTDFVIVKN